jgi:rubredoxin---NAD+ reductase
MTAQEIASESGPVVIIGAGLAGWTTARELRKLTPDLPITLITADSGDFYAKPALSNALAQGKSPSQLVNTPAAQMAAQHKVLLLAHTQVSAIDRSAKQVQTSAGPVAYSQLVLATGAQPIRIPLQGAAAQQVLSVNSLEDYALFRAKLAGSPDETCADCYENSSDLAASTAAPRRQRQVLIMGAGLIGCEFANDLAAQGFGVTVVDPGARPLAALLPEEASLALQAALPELGVEWKLGTSVQRLEHGVGGESGDALAVQLADGSWLAADMVLSAVGLRPDLSLAQAAGLATERGIKVSDHLQTSDDEIYALGDGAQYASESLQGTSRPLPYVLPIMQAAKVLAANIWAKRQGGALSVLKFPVMPVAIKTPALPLTIAPPEPGMSGAWQAFAEQEWQWLDAQGALKGFALAGAASTQRAKWVKALEAA